MAGVEVFQPPLAAVTPAEGKFLDCNQHPSLCCRCDLFAAQVGPEVGIAGGEGQNALCLPWTHPQCQGVIGDESPVSEAAQPPAGTEQAQPCEHLEGEWGAVDPAVPDDQPICGRSRCEAALAELQIGLFCLWG